MKIIKTMIAVALAVGCQAAIAQNIPPATVVIGSETIVAHGGGCRKDSPPGQCCHAGSQPYHCH